MSHVRTSNLTQTPRQCSHHPSPTAPPTTTAPAPRLSPGTSSTECQWETAGWDELLVGAAT
eukprot:1705119-Alexandrium_andersonii.AAC.1